MVIQSRSNSLQRQLNTRCRRRFSAVLEPPGVYRRWHQTAGRLEPLVASCPVFTVSGTELPTSSCHFLVALVLPTVANFLSGTVHHLEVILPLYPAWWFSGSIHNFHSYPIGFLFTLNRYCKIPLIQLCKGFWGGLYLGGLITGGKIVFWNALTENYFNTSVHT